MAVDFSSKCYLFVSVTLLGLSQNIQNEISLEPFADVVTYQFINFNWKLNGSRKKNIHDHALTKAVVEGLRQWKSQC